jgi:hypothetical protein
VENGRVLVYCAEGSNISTDHCKHKAKNSSSSGTEYGEMSERLHSGEWWALPAPFMNCILRFYCIVVHEVELLLRFKINTL